MAIFGFYGLAITGAVHLLCKYHSTNRIVDGVLSLQGRSSTSGMVYSRILYRGCI